MSHGKRRRAHMENIVPVVDAALKQAYIELNEIDGFAFTQSPGLIGALLVGAQFTKSLALATGKPLITVHHMYPIQISNCRQAPPPTFPFLWHQVSSTGLTWKILFLLWMRH